MGKAIRPSLALALILTAIAGLIWTALNAGSVPAYGDTVEYLHDAQTLQVDQYRTILYPLMLRILGVVSHGATPFTPWIYATQWLMLVLSTAFFATAVLLTIRPNLAKTRLIWVIACATLIIVTDPLIAHLSITLMSDSLASSFTVAAIGGLCLAFSISPPAPPIHRRWLATGIFFLFLMALSRVDKLYLAAAACIATLVWNVRFATNRSHPQRIATIFILMIGTLAAVVSVNKKTQTFNVARPPLDLSSMAFNRVVWPRLSKVYPYLPPRDQHVISREDAAYFDVHNNHVYPLIAKLLTENPANRHILNNITIVTLRRFPLEVAGKTLFDITKYILPNLAFPLELAHILPLSVGTDWTYSRMAMPWPTLTEMTLWISQLSFFLVQIPLALLAFRRFKWPPLTRGLTFWLTGVVIVTNGLLFGLEAGMDSYIRYALPSYTLIHTIVAVAAMIWVLDTTPSTTYYVKAASNKQESIHAEVHSPN